MLKPTKLTTIKAYLTVLGLQESSSKDGFELWEGNSKEVLICVAEPTFPVFSIITMLHELEESEEAFLRIAAVIR